MPYLKNETPMPEAWGPLVAALQGHTQITQAEISTLQAFVADPTLAPTMGGEAILIFAATAAQHGENALLANICIKRCLTRRAVALSHLIASTDTTLIKLTREAHCQRAFDIAPDENTWNEVKASCPHAAPALTRDRLKVLEAAGHPVGTEAQRQLHLELNAANEAMNAGNPTPLSAFDPKRLRQGADLVALGHLGRTSLGSQTLFTGGWVGIVKGDHELATELFTACSQTCASTWLRQESKRWVAHVRAESVENIAEITTAATLAHLHQGSGATPRTATVEQADKWRALLEPALGTSYIAEWGWEQLTLLYWNGGDHQQAEALAGICRTRCKTAKGLAAAHWLTVNFIRANERSPTRRQCDDALLATQDFPWVDLLTTWCDAIPDESPPAKGAGN